MVLRNHAAGSKVQSWLSERPIAVHISLAYGVASGRVAATLARSAGVAAMRISNDHLSSAS